MNVKRLLIITLAAVLLPVSGAFAILHLGVSAGYSYATMDGLKTGFQQIKDAAVAASRTASVGDFGTAVYSNVDLDFGADMLILAARTGVQYVLPVDIQINDPVDASLNTTISYSAFLVPIMMGLNFNIKIPDNPYRISVAAYAGYGIAFVTQTYKPSAGYVMNPQGAVFDSVFQGGGLMYEGSGSFEFNLFDFLTCGINAGYTYAKFTGLKPVTKVAISNTAIIPAEQIINAPANQERSADFSGFTGGIGLNLRL